MKRNNLTNQADKESTDINKILDKYAKSGQLPALMAKDPRYGDFSDMPDYMEAHERIVLANEQFMALDARVRKQFGNDPAEFLKYASNPANLDGMIELGLASKRPIIKDDKLIGHKVTVGTKETIVEAPKEPSTN